MRIERIKIDSKGRIVLPSSFRTALALDQGDVVYLSLDEQNSAIVISTKPDESLYSLVISMDDAPGTLAKLATVLAEQNVDLVATESHSLTRSKEAVWRVIAKFEGDWNKMIRELKKKGANKIEKRKI